MGILKMGGTATSSNATTTTNPNNGGGKPVAFSSFDRDPAGSTGTIVCFLLLLFVMFLFCLILFDFVFICHFWQLFNLYFQQPIQINTIIRTSKELSENSKKWAQQSPNALLAPQLPSICTGMGWNGRRWFCWEMGIMFGLLVAIKQPQL